MDVDQGRGLGRGTLLRGRLLAPAAELATEVGLFAAGFRALGLGYLKLLFEVLDPAVEGLFLEGPGLDHPFCARHALCQGTGLCDQGLGLD